MVKPIPSPWSLHDNGSAFEIRDAGGRAFAYLYYEENPRRVSPRHPYRADAEAVAKWIVRLPAIVKAVRD